ncbi:ArsR/SmtB family transcription factor [Kitasatospora sp. NPDC057965]|uniref:ArsR/SmtB family transcription factor n=1 Tax=Kitasatospora sp. NPDC057965 TaxID=3346291 RepID=UPI0036D81973
MTAPESEPCAPRAACAQPPAQARPLTEADIATLVPLLKALADPIRLRLVALIAAEGGGEVCVCDLTAAFTVAQSTISHHLKILRTAGVIDGERRGTWVYYRVLPDALQLLAPLLTAVPAPSR